MASVGERRKPKGTEEGEEEIDLFRERIREAAGMLEFLNFVQFKYQVIIVFKLIWNTSAMDK